jgi:hypothetical protein
MEELRRRRNEKCNERRQLCCIPETDSETDSFQGYCIEVGLYLTVMCIMTLYAASDCYFRQDAHRRMPSLIARIRCAEERERGERAKDHQTVNGEKLFMSVTSAECTEVEYATERYSE